MKPAWFSPTAEAVDLLAELPAKVAALRASGARFLAFPVTEIREAAEWALACFHSPVTFVPLPPSLPPQVLEKRLAQLPGNVIFPSALRPAHAGASATLRPLEEIWAVIFSSGTTGTPKGIALTGNSLKASAEAHALHSGAANATWLLDLPLFHVGGLSVLTRALFLDAPIALSTPSAVSTKEWIKSGRIHGLSQVPTTLVRLLRDPDINFAGISLILLGGAPATQALVEEARARGAPVRRTYGMTEHSSQAATEKKPGGGLRALPGVEIKICEGDEILLRSPALAAGIFEHGELKPLPLRDGFFPTGDLGSLKEGALTIFGRASELVISGGKKIYPAEVEAALAKVNGVGDCAVLGLPDAEWGEVLCAAVTESTPGMFRAEIAKTEMSASLESHQIPKVWVLLPAIPRSPAGKILRPDLKRAVTQIQS